MPSYTANVIANVLKVQARSVYRLAEQEVIPKPDADGKFDLVASVHGYIDFLRSRHGGSKSALSAQKFSAERARLYEARADIAEVERARLAAELVSADEVETAWIDMITIAKARMLALPSKMAPRLALISSPTKIRELLESELYAALGELATADVAIDTGQDSPHRRNGARNAQGMVAAPEADSESMG